MKKEIKEECIKNLDEYLKKKLEGYDKIMKYTSSRDEDYLIHQRINGIQKRTEKAFEDDKRYYEE